MHDFLNCFCCHAGYFNLFGPEFENLTRPEIVGLYQYQNISNYKFMQDTYYFRDNDSCSVKVLRRVILVHTVEFLRAQLASR